MRAVTVPEPGVGFEQVERDAPTPAATAVRIDVAACGICHGDTTVTEGRPPITYPRVPGHEIAGTIDAVGQDVTGWAAGDRVAVGWHGGHCFTCAPCRRGDFVNCDHERITGIHHDGGYATQVTVPAEALMPIPEGMDPAAAAPLACAGLTGYSALTAADVRPGDRVAVQGLGGVGHLAVQFADAFGYETVALSRGTAKRDAAHELGADEFIDTTDGEPATALRDRGGADLILATAPDSDAMAAVLGGLRPNGDLVAIGAPDAPVPIEIPPMLGNRWSVHGWSAGHAGDGAAALAAAARTGVTPWVERYDLAEVDRAFQRMRDGETRFKAVLTP